MNDDMNRLQLFILYISYFWVKDKVKLSICSWVNTGMLRSQLIFSLQKLVNAQCERNSSEQNLGLAAPSICVSSGSYVDVLSCLR